MIRQLSANGLKFKTPEFSGEIASYSNISFKHKKIDFKIAKENVLDLKNAKVGVVFSGAEVDVVGYIDETPFVIYITYKGRIVPGELCVPEPERCGVIELNLNDLLRLFREEKEGQYKEVLRKFLEERNEGKNWIYHPREKKRREEAEQQMDDWKSQQQSPPPKNAYLQQRYNPTRNVPAKTKLRKQGASFIPTQREVRNFTCVRCGSRWQGISNHCENCKTHLYSTTS